jgi:hypothetical protein
MSFGQAFGEMHVINLRTALRAPTAIIVKIRTRCCILVAMDTTLRQHIAPMDARQVARAVNARPIALVRHFLIFFPLELFSMVHYINPIQHY